MQKKMDVDLKYSLWCVGKEDWDSDVYEAMSAAFHGTEPEITICTAPNKEIRYGEVTIRKGSADVQFCAVWDSPDSLSTETVGEDVITEYFENRLGFWYGGDPIGAEVTKTVTADTFEELMENIDNCESELNEQECANSEEFDKMLETINESAIS